MSQPARLRRRRTLAIGPDKPNILADSDAADGLAAQDRGRGRRNIMEITDPELSAELDALSAQFTDADYNALEAELRLRAAVLHWTGDPMCQPLETVLAAARSVLAARAKP